VAQFVDIGALGGEGSLELTHRNSIRCFFCECEVTHQHPQEPSKREKELVLSRAPRTMRRMNGEAQVKSFHDVRRLAESGAAFEQ
jgi:hypothetical protein